MRDHVTLYRHLSLAEPKPRIILIGKITRQARGSITTQVKTKAWHEGNFVVMVVFILQSIAIFAFPKSRCLGTTGTDPSALANPRNSTNGASSDFFHQADALAPHGAPTSTSLETWRRQTTIRRAAHEAPQLSARTRMWTLTFKPKGKASGKFDGALTAAVQGLNFRVLFGPLPVALSTVPAPDLISQTPYACAVFVKLYLSTLANNSILAGV